MNPGLNSIKSYQIANKNMGGDLRFFWPVSMNFIYAFKKDGTWAVINTVQFKSFDAKVE